MPRAFALFAHPDDEVIALGARLARLQCGRLVHATDGAPRNESDSRARGFAKLADYRCARAQELEQALRFAGLQPSQCECLHIADQEASLSLFSLTLRVSALLQAHQPEVIFTHPYEGGHPDHDACSFAVHHAVKLLQGQLTSAPLIVEAPFYNAARSDMAAGVFLENAPQQPQVRYELTEEEQQRKQKLMACFTTQRETLRIFRLTEECYRVAPQYDYRKPPHASPVLYDRQPWGMTSQRFCELAAEAEDVLQEESAGSWR